MMKTTRPRFKTTCIIKLKIDYQYRLALNQTRVNYAQGADYTGAEQMLEQITDIRSEAESRIRLALREKHRREVNAILSVIIFLI